MAIGGLVLVAALVIGTVSVLGGDDDDHPAVEAEDPYPESPDFHLTADAQPFAGPVPMEVQFKGQPFKAKGDVKYFWRFDDGTTSTEKDPKHTFKEPGTYNVTVDARDEEAPDKQRYTLILGAWPAKLWSTSENRRLTRAEQLNAIKAQAKRTAARRKALGEGEEQAGAAE